jgi:hypothetical protein
MTVELKKFIREQGKFIETYLNVSLDEKHYIRMLVENAAQLSDSSEAIRLQSKLGAYTQYINFSWASIIIMSFAAGFIFLVLVTGLLFAKYFIEK